MRSVNSKGRRTCFLVVTVAMLALAGCSPQWSAGFPEVRLQRPTSGATKIGVAQVEDSRPDYAVGWVGRAQLLAGPNLADYIERKFRNGLTERGFDPIEALDPARTSVAQPYKIVVVTVRSASFKLSGVVSETASSIVEIRARIYSPARGVIYAASYAGKWSGPAHRVNTSVVAGSLIAPAASRAVVETLADPSFERELH